MIRTAIVTISDGVAAGTREDKSGAALARRIGRSEEHTSELQSH